MHLWILVSAGSTGTDPGTTVVMFLGIQRLYMDFQLHRGWGVGPPKAGVIQESAV